METNFIKEKKNKIIEQYGEWTAHNIQLTEDIYTIKKRVVGQENQLRRITQIISDIFPEPISNLRILDLACLEGLYAVEFALRGAKVLAVEGREANFKKAQFAKDVLGLSNLTVIQDDVRNLSAEKLGYFDVVLCAGILYHLDAPDVFNFVERLAEVCKGVTLIDTHISLTGEEFRTFNNKKYWGSQYTEFSEEATAPEKEKALWSSLDNSKSFWFSPSSLFNLLQECQFTSVYECHVPVLLSEPHDRLTLLAFKGKRQPVLSAPLVNQVPFESYPDSEIPQIPQDSHGKEGDISLKTELERTQLKLQETQLELERLQILLQAMESSKFWQLRQLWFRLKGMIGVKER